VARNASSEYYLPFVAYGISAALYLCISSMLIWFFRKAERKWLAYLR
jgi:histidine transport system permease protein